MIPYFILFSDHKKKKKGPFRATVPQLDLPVLLFVGHKTEKKTMQLLVK